MSLKGTATPSRKERRKKQTKIAMGSGLLAGALFVTTGFTGTGQTKASIPDNTHNFTINVDGRTIQKKTVQTDPSNVLTKSGVVLWQGDDYELQHIDDKHTEITIRRAVPVTIAYDGKTKEILTNKTTVREALLEQGYQLENIETPTGLDTQITRNMTIDVEDNAAIRAEKERARRSIETSRGMERYSAVLTMEASAYLPFDGGGAGITASGMLARYGVVAVDPNVIPLGTRLYIPGYGEAIAADTGGAIRGHMIDLCMEDYGSAIAFGRHDIQVYVLD